MLHLTATIYDQTRRQWSILRREKNQKKLWSGNRRRWKRQEL